MPTPLVCLSHVAWFSGADHPGHLMTCLARHREVVVLERSAAHAPLPLLGAARSGDVTVVTRYLPAGVEREEEPRVLAPLLEALLESEGVLLPILWVCDAQSLPVAARLRPTAVVYDCPWGLEYRHDRSRAAAESAVLRVANLVVVHDARDATRLRDRHPLVHLVPDDAGARPAPAGADTTARLLDDLLQTLVEVRPSLLLAATSPERPTMPSPPPTKPEPDEPPRPPATAEPAEADQAIDIAGTEADEPAVGAAVEDSRRRRSEPDDVNYDDPRR